MRRTRGAWGSCYGRRSGWLWVVGSKGSVLPIVGSAAGHGLIVMGCLASDGSWPSMVRGHGRWEIVGGSGRSCWTACGVGRAGRRARVLLLVSGDALAAVASSWIGRSC
ncbi:hypothetical protein ACLOJK_036980 [Asimina triloba]